MPPSTTARKGEESHDPTGTSRQNHPGISTDEIVAHFGLPPDRYFVHTDSQPEIALHPDGEQPAPLHHRRPVGTLRPVIEWKGRPQPLAHGRQRRDLGSRWVSTNCWPAPSASPAPASLGSRSSPATTTSPSTPSTSSSRAAAPCKAPTRRKIRADHRGGPRRQPRSIPTSWRRPSALAAATDRLQRRCAKFFPPTVDVIRARAQA